LRIREFAGSSLRVVLADCLKLPNLTVREDEDGPTDHCACADGRYMKMNTLEKLRDCLQDLSSQIIIPENLRARAEIPIRRMLELSRN